MTATLPAFPARPAIPLHGSAARFEVRRIYCVGRNYLAHIREMKEADERDPPFFFHKPSDAIVLDDGVVAYPPDTEDFQHEVELVAAIGRQGFGVDVAHALDLVFGYAVGIDLTRRDRQRESLARGLPWEPGKSFDHSAPCGPLLPVAVTGHPARGRIALSVNGEVRQAGDLAQMIWSVPEIVARLSQSYRLCPGDLIMTGTPAGVGRLIPGDRVEAAIDGLAPLHVRIGERDAGA
jgi:fumarylpyruvate hydrolase